MKKISLTLMFLLASSPFALASDLPKSKGLPPAPVSLPTLAVYDWTGFYVGAHAGYAFGSDKATLSITKPVTYSSGVDISPKGFLGGVQAGYNYQYSQYVAGLEISGGYLGLDGKKTDASSIELKEKSTYYGTATGRIGYTYDRYLGYLKGGLAVANLEDTLTGTNISASEKKLRLGYTLGAGVEYAVTDDISAKLEYDYMAFGKKSAGWANSTGTVAGSFENKTTVHAVMVGLNYHFGYQPAPAPLTRKY